MHTDFLTCSWPLAGRSDEVAELAGRLIPPPAGRVLLLGEAGVGKTALWRQVLERCRERGGHVLTAACSPSTSDIPFLALSDWAGMPLGGASGTVESLRGAVRERAGSRPLVLGVDDADHLDAASASLVADLAGEAGAALLLTARSPAPQEGVLQRLMERVPCRTWQVQPLSENAFAGLLRDVLDGPVDSLTTGSLWRMSSGNPLFLRHLLLAGAESGGLHRRHGVWTWRGPAGGHPRLRDLVASTVGVVPDEEARALEYVAQAGSVPRGALESLVGAAVLDRLVRRSLVTAFAEAEGEQVRVAHPLYGEVVRAGTGPLRRRRIHRDLADAVDRCGGATDPIRPVLWRLRAGAEVPEGRLVRAASAALLHSDAELARRLVAHLHTPEAVRVHGQALVAQGRAAEAEELLAARNGPPALRALNLFWGLRRPEEARAVLDALDEAESKEPETKVASRALALFTHGESHARQVLPSVLEAGDSGDWLADNASATLRAYALTLRGRPALVTAEFERGAIPLPPAWGSMRGATEACHVYAMVMAGRLDEALRTAGRYYREALERGDQAEVALVAFIHGVALYWAGRPDLALELLSEAQALVDEQTIFPVEGYIVTEYASCAAALGRTEEASDALARAAGGFPEGSSMRENLTKGEVRVHAAAGRVALAADLADRLAETYLAGGRLTTGVEIAYLCCRLRPGASAALRLEQAVAECDSELFSLFALHGRALADRDPCGLSAVAEELAALGYAGLALEAVVAARGLSTGRASDELARRAEELRQHCRAGPGTALPETAGHTGRLTSRERQICELAASGMSNPAVAGYLDISVRTVSNHLQRAYDKLGVKRRAELGAALALPPAPGPAAPGPGVRE